MAPGHRDRSADRGGRASVGHPAIRRPAVRAKTHLAGAVILPAREGKPPTTGEDSARFGIYAPSIVSTGHLHSRVPEPLEARLERAGAVMVTRGGRRVAAHYGSVSGEIAVCRKAVGLAVRTDLCVLALTGQASSLEALLSTTTGASIPRPGQATRTGGMWCARVDAKTAFIVGSVATVTRWKRLVHQALVTGTLPGTVETPIEQVVLSLTGPRLGELFANLGLSAGSPAPSVRLCSVQGEPTVLIAEPVGGALLLMAPDAAPTVCAALFDAGEPAALALVGMDALARLEAAAAYPPCASSADQARS